MDKKKGLLTVCLLFLFACAHINYVGKTYPQTKNVDVFFSTPDSADAYDIMGYAIGAGQVFILAEDLQNKLIEEAQQKGADAIIITGVDRDSEFEGDGYDAEKQVKATFIRYRFR